MEENDPDSYTDTNCYSQYNSPAKRTLLEVPDNYPQKSGGDSVQNGTLRVECTYIYHIGHHSSNIFNVTDAVSTVRLRRRVTQWTDGSSGSLFVRLLDSRAIR